VTPLIIIGALAGLAVLFALLTRHAGGPEWEDDPIIRQDRTQRALRDLGAEVDRIWKR
jgi:hypothetical protein